MLIPKYFFLIINLFYYLMALYKKMHPKNVDKFLKTSANNLFA